MRLVRWAFSNAVVMALAVVLEIMSRLETDE
jgi:hypothetical protein